MKFKIYLLMSYDPKGNCRVLKAYGSRLDANTGKARQTLKSALRNIGLTYHVIETEYVMPNLEEPKRLSRTIVDIESREAVLKQFKMKPFDKKARAEMRELIAQRDAEKTTKQPLPTRHCSGICSGCCTGGYVL